MRPEGKGDSAEPRRGRSLRSSFLFASGLVTIFLILIISLVAMMVFVQEFMRSTEETHAAIAEEGGYLMGLFLDSAVEDLLRAGRVYNSTAGSAAPAIQQGLVLDGRFRSVRFADASGTVVAAYPDPGIVGFSLQGGPELEAREGLPYKGRIALGLSGELSISLSIRRGDIFLVGDLNLDWLGSLVETLSIGETGVAAVLDRDGTIVAHTDRSLVEQRVNVSNQALVADARDRGTAAGVYRTSSGISRIGAARRIDRWDWILVVSRDLNDALSSVFNMAKILSAGFALCGTIFFLIIRRITRRMLTPLSILVEGVRDMAAGDYGALTTVPRSFAEIDVLVREFDGMAHRVANREERLEQTVREKDLLLREVHHRVKNNMQIVSSMISLQRSSIEEGPVAELFEEAERRVQSMAMIHERLYLSEDMASIDILEFVGELAQSVAHGAGWDCSVRGDSVLLGLDQAVPCALAVNELALNAGKHGCGDRRCTAIEFSVRREGDLVAVAVADDGPGLPDGFNPELSGGLGMSIVLALAAQLKGTLAWDHAPSGGAVFILRFPFLDPASRGVVH